ncbi:MAG: hypothetical protein D6681_21700 [Calditrichaeota bacterium]|nr:MAG: hypothetical protein D6681_21700 [Calditrichota bacterium]
MRTAVATLDRDLAGTTTATPAIRELTMEELDWVYGRGGADTVAASTGGGFVAGFTFGSLRAAQLGATIARAALIGVGVGTGVGVAAFVLTTVAFIAADYLLGND